MVISKEEENEILVLYNNEKMSIGTVASLINRHHSTVTRVIAQYSATKNATSAEPTKFKHESKIAPYRAFIEEKLETYPKIKASALFRMIKERGYKGKSSGNFRRYIAPLRPKPHKEAFLKLLTLSGEQAQVDWGEFGYIQVQGGKRKLLAFIMTLSYSRAVFVHFYLEGKTSEFQDGFIRAFNFFCGIPRIIILDNLKSGVLERVQKIIRFNERFLAISRHYCFEPQPANPRRGNEKGKVERNVRYLRENFFDGTSWRDVEHLNCQVKKWCENEAMQRQWCRGDTRTIRDIFEIEKKSLLKLPKDTFPVHDKILVNIGKVPYARYDTNDYSVPAIHVGTRLIVFASVAEIVIADEQLREVAKHARCWGKHQTLTDTKHTEEILVQKNGARKDHGMARLISGAPKAEDFIVILAQQGQHIGGAVNSLLKIMDGHGKDVLNQALGEVMNSGSPRLQLVHLVVNRLVQDQKNPNRILPVSVPKIAANLHYEHHSLSRYDQIAEELYNE
jgi:transposase